MKNSITATLKKLFCIFSISSFLAMSIQAPVFAGMVTNDDLNTANQMEIKRDDVRTLVAREDVRSHLQQYGVDPADLDARIDSMTDSEIMQFQAEMDNLPAGQGVLGTVIALIVIFMLLDIAGATDVFPGI